MALCDPGGKGGGGTCYDGEFFLTCFVGNNLLVIVGGVGVLRQPKGLLVTVWIRVFLFALSCSRARAVAQNALVVFLKPCWRVFFVFLFTRSPAPRPPYVCVCVCFCNKPCWSASSVSLLLPNTDQVRGTVQSSRFCHVPPFCLLL